MDKGMRLGRLLGALVALSLVGSGGSVKAASSFSPTSDTVPPNIFFLVDASSTMGTCWNSARTDTTGDGTISDLDQCTPPITSTSSVWRRKSVVDVIKAVVKSVDGAQFGLAITDPLITTTPANPMGIGDRPGLRDGIIVPLGSTRAEFLAALDTLNTGASSSGTVGFSATNAVPLAEALDNVREYFENGYHTTNATFAYQSPIEYWCQKSHVILITDGVTPILNAVTNPTPDIDKNVTGSIAAYPASPSFNPTLASTVGYYNRYLENVASYMATTDLAPGVSDTSGGQYVYTHVMALDYDQQLLQYTAANGLGTYAVVKSASELESEIWGVLNDIMSGTYVVAPPTVSVKGDQLFLGYFDIKPDRPLYYGHLLAYDIEDDATSSNYGQIDTSVTQPAWDAGEILASRFVGQQDIMSKDNNGVDIRDIYTNINQDKDPDPFDGSKLSTLCPMMLDKTQDSSTGDYYGVSKGHDLDGDGDVDDYDCIELMDFVRGYYLADFSSTGLPRGHWKLGDIRHSQVAVAESEPNIYTRNTVMRTFLEQLASDNMMSDCPYGSVSKCLLDVAFVTANDGMLHAFNKYTGDELWAYIPRNLLGEVAGTEEMAELLDMVKGESLIMDATPRVDYVWIDGYCSYSSAGCTRGAITTAKKDGTQEPQEWVRVLLVGQGGGGRYYLALDITNPQFPIILWEDTNDTAPIAGMGATVSTPVAGVVYDGSNGPAYDRWVAFFGSGEGDTDAIEARLYIKAIGDVTSVSPTMDTYADTGMKVKIDLNGDGSDDGVGFPSNPTAVDKDNDGDIDEVFLVSSSGVMYKFVINTSSIDSTAGCLFFDPENAKVNSSGSRVKIGARAKAYWAATAAFNPDGNLVLYWGTGSPYDLYNLSGYGYLYAVLDSSACSEGILYTECNSGGYLQLSKGEKLTGSPVVFAGGVYFSTFQPGSDPCTPGTSRLYGLNYESCQPAMDTNNDGTVDSSDSVSSTLGEGVPSGVVISHDGVYVATSDGLAEGDVKDSVTRVDLEGGFMGTAPIQYRELF